MWHNKKNSVLMVVLMILGIVMAVQVRSIIASNDQKASQSLNDAQKLTNSIKIEKEASEELKKLVDQKERQREEYLKNSIISNRDSYFTELKQQLDEVKLKAGLTDVKGSGIIIVLDDAEAGTEHKSEEDEGTLLIHDMDIVKVLNELKKAGAQAISLNGERIVSITEQICAGPTVRINNRRYTTPFEIKAIGDKDNLYRELENSKIVYLMLKDKVRVSMKKADDIVIPKFIHNTDGLFSGLEVVGG
jgi:uncharacterized protein YlxW (UPF0749 family)